MKMIIGNLLFVTLFGICALGMEELPNVNVSQPEPHTSVATETGRLSLGSVHVVAVDQKRVPGRAESRVSRTIGALANTGLSRPQQSKTVDRDLSNQENSDNTGFFLSSQGYQEKQNDTGIRRRLQGLPYVADKMSKGRKTREAVGVFFSTLIAGSAITGFAISANNPDLLGWPMAGWTILISIVLLVAAGYYFAWSVQGCVSTTRDTMILFFSVLAASTMGVAALNGITLLADNAAETVTELNGATNAVLQTTADATNAAEALQTMADTTDAEAFQGDMVTFIIMSAVGFVSLVVAVVWSTCFKKDNKCCQIYIYD